MMKHLGLAALILASACAAPSGEHELDQEAIEDGADGKADTYSFTRLERATPAQVANAIAERRGEELTDCFAEYKTHVDGSVTAITSDVIDGFLLRGLDVEDSACTYDLFEIAEGVLEHLGTNEATVSELIAGIVPWATPQLVASSIGGYVTTDDLPLFLYYDLVRVRDDNAMARETAPAGIDLAWLRAQWKDVRKYTTLDAAYLNPVTFPAGAIQSSNLFKYLRAAFPLRNHSYVSGGYTAIREFAEAGEGPAGDPAFAPIATALRKRSIKKRFYFYGAGDNWSSNVLIVIDEHGQAWGMQMGYSE